MNRIQPLAFCALACVICAGIPASDWPNFRGPNHNGISDEALPNKDWKAKPPKELWRITMTDRGYAGPSVAAGKMFILDHKENREIVRAIDIKSGKDAWDFPYDDTAKDNYGYGRSTPTYDAGRLYTFSRLGILHCLDAKEGTPIWELDVKTKYGGRWRAESWDYASSPLIDGDKLIVCAGGPGASVVALNKADGKEVWKGGGDDQAGYATPVKATIGGKSQYVVFTGLNVMGVDAEKGAQLWSSAWHTSYDVNAATPLVIGNNVFITSNYGAGCELLDASVNPPKELWRYKVLKAHFNTPVFFEGHIYGIGDPGELNCIVAETGIVKWKKAGFEKGGVCGIDGMIVAINGSAGDVVLAKMTPEGYQESGRIKPLDRQSWTAPIIAGGKLYVRNLDALVCLDLNPQ
ncbi:MAG TPA: PQQ-binding-like beta-propeller repeat protein [Planctomycetota bacterium]|nr:PQQ-binding-like beta-propeller repeat protein [Planctomycetota bacterium]